MNNKLTKVVQLLINLSLLIMIGTLSKELFLTQEYIGTIGTVIDIADINQEELHPDTKTFLIKYDVNGDYYICQRQLFLQKKDIIGSTVSVKYNPENPQQTRNDYLLYFCIIWIAILIVALLSMKDIWIPKCFLKSQNSRTKRKKNFHKK